MYTPLLLSYPVWSLAGLWYPRDHRLGADHALSGQCQCFCLQWTPCCARPSGAGRAEGHGDLSGHLHTQLSSKDSSSIHQETVSFIEEGNPSLWPLGYPEIDGAQGSATSCSLSVWRLSLSSCSFGIWWSSLWAPFSIQEYQLHSQNRIFKKHSSLESKTILLYFLFPPYLFSP